MDAFEIDSVFFIWKKKRKNIFQMNHLTHLPTKKKIYQFKCKFKSQSVIIDETGFMIKSYFQ